MQQLMGKKTVLVVSNNLIVEDHKCLRTANEPIARSLSQQGLGSPATCFPRQGKPTALVVLLFFFLVLSVPGPF